MGRTIKTLFKGELPGEIFANRVAVERDEKFHVHIGFLRLIYTKTNMAKFFQIVQNARNAWFQAGCQPEEEGHRVLEEQLLPQEPRK